VQKAPSPAQPDMKVLQALVVNKNLEIKDMLEDLE